MNAKHTVYLHLMPVVILPAVILLSLLILLDRMTLPTQAGGTTCYVASGGACGGATPCYSNVQAAVDAAQPGDEIRVATGIYTGVSIRPRNDTTTTGVVTQVVYLTKTVTIRGGYTTTNWTTSDPVANPTTLDAQGLGRVIYITGNISPTIEGLRIARGNATGLGGAVGDYDGGGGVYISNARATISNDRVFSNTATDGGGVFLRLSAATLSGNVVTSNTAQEDGGGVHLIVSPATLSGNTVTANTAGQGGGLYLWGSDAMLNGNTVASNTALLHGGGMYVNWSAATLNGDTVTANTAQYDGGGVVLWYHSDAMLINTVVADNRGNTLGSGLYIGGSFPRLLHTTIARNVGGDGSGIYVTDDGTNLSTVAMTNTILVSHTVGISVTGSNTATVNGILWYNTPVTVSQATTASVTIQNQYQGNSALASDGYHLTASSAAIDRGVDASVTTDIDGQARPQGAAPDLGADEYPVPPSSVTLTGPTDGTCHTVCAFTATVSPIMATTPITYIWQATGQLPVTHADSLRYTDTVNFTWPIEAAGVKVITVTAANAGGAVTGTQIIVANVLPASSGGIVVIVAGHNDAYALQDNILYASSLAYRTFLSGGIPETHLRYLSTITDSRTDADGDGVSEVYTTSASSNVQAAITTWAASLTSDTIPFYLYMMSFGGVDYFMADGNSDTITPDELDGWLNQLETAVPGVKVNVIIEAAKAGSFIDGTFEMSKQGRAVVASTSSTLNAYASAQGAYFSDAFFWALGQGQSLWASFRAGRAAIQGFLQEPWLDDSGDATANGADDGAVAASRFLFVPLDGVVINGPTTGTVNTSYTFTATVNPIMATTPVTYVWQATGQSPAMHTSSLSDTATFTWTSPGLQVITITAQNVGGTVTDTCTVTVYVPPTDVVITGPTSGLANTAYAFSATVSPVTATTPITYTWTPTPDSGQGTANATYMWTTTGTKTVTVTAQNPANTVTDTHTIVISTPPPEVTPLTDVTISGPTAGITNVVYSFAATVSPVAATTPITYTWTPTPNSGQGTANATYTWSTPGDKTITVTAQNPANTVTGTHAITLSAAPPSVGDTYEPDDTCAQARVILTDGSVQQHTFHVPGDSDWVAFQGISGTMYLIEARTPADSRADVTLEVYDACNGVVVGRQGYIFSPDVRLQFQSYANTTYYARLLDYDPNGGSAAHTYQLSVRASGVAAPGALVLVAGRVRIDDPLNRNIHNITNHVCRLFINHGYPSQANGTDDRIYYLAAPDQDCGEGNSASDTDGDPTKANLQYAITTWAVGKGLGPDRALTLYLMDHGGEDVLYLNGRNDTVGPDELDIWLSQLEAAAPGVRVNIILEACHSGSFIDGLKRLSQPDKNRVIIASTSATMVAFASPDGAVFSDAFISGLERGLSLYGAFEEGKEAHPIQVPWLDDDGDGIANGPDDGQEAAHRGFAYAGTFPEEQWPPYVVWARVGPVVAGRSVITAEIQDDKSVLAASAVIYKPSYQLPTGDEMVQETLPSVTLLDQDGDHVYTGLYERFDEIGEYRVVIYAVDGESLKGRPRVIRVSTGSKVYLPLVLR